MNGGYIKLHRKMIEWDWYTEPVVLMVFIHCLYKANYKDLSFKGRPIKRGSFVTSLGNFSAELNISVQNLRTALRKLKLTNEITSETNRQYTIIHVVNYCKYQDVTNELTNVQQTTNKRLTTSKERKKEKKAIKEFVAPTEIEFRKEAYRIVCDKFNDQYWTNEVKGMVRIKYDDWDKGGWLNGRTKEPIQDWKRTLGNSIPYILGLK